VIFKDMPAREFIAWCKARVGGAGLAGYLATVPYSAREWWGVTDRGDWMLWVMAEAVPVTSRMSEADARAYVQATRDMSTQIAHGYSAAGDLDVTPEPGEIESAARLRVANWLRRSVKVRWIESVGRP